MLRWTSARNIARLAQRCSYTTASTSPKSPKIADENLDDVDGKKVPPQTDKESSAKQSKLIAAAFASLQQIKRTSRSHPPKTSHFDEKLNSAKDVDSLLSIAEQPIVAKHHALKVMNKLSDWVKTGECKLSDFDADGRFIKLCGILGRSPSSDIVTKMSTDLKIVLSVAVDDQAAKLINTIQLPQMVKILHSLAMKKRRSVSLLQSLSYNISIERENEYE